MQEDPDEISKLLRLKRFEQPPADYFEDFLQEFKDRQRAQLLREPVWRIAWDRLEAFFGERMPVRLGYGMASAAVLVAAGIASFDILESRPLEMAQTAAIQQVHPAPQAASLDLLNGGQVQLPDLPSMSSRMAQTAAVSAPYYVMDARPVSLNEPPSSF